MNVISPATQLLLALSMLRGVGPATLKKIALTPGFIDIPIEQLAKNIPQIDRAIIGSSDAWSIAQEEAIKQVDQAKQHNARIISAIDSEYPSLLAATKDDPFILYVQGSLFKKPENSVAIIGTREPTGHGRIIAERITQFFAEQNWSVVSGLAIGCDAIAHQAALDVGAHTVAVMAHGLQMVAPSRHKKLAQEILTSGGALISEYPFGQNVQNQQYVKRDRTQAGMAQGVVMIQSDLKGGSLHASRATLDYGRWLAVPYPTEKDRCTGEPKVQANLLISDGFNEQKTELLRCNREALNRLIILKSREDYLQMIGTKENTITSSILQNFLEDQSIHGLKTNEKQKITSSTKIDIDELNLVTYSEYQDSNINKTNETQRTENSIASQKNFLNTRVIVSANSFDRKDIENLLPSYFSTLKNSEKLVENYKSIENLAARIHYIKLRVLEIEKIAYSESINNEIDSNLVAQLSIEDLLTQMRKATETLNSLHVFSESLNSKNKAGKSVQSVSLYTSFNELINIHNYSVAIKDKINDLITTKGTEKEGFENRNQDLHLHDIINSFNQLISQANVDLCNLQYTQDIKNH